MSADHTDHGNRELQSTRSHGRHRTPTQQRTARRGGTAQQNERVTVLTLHPPVIRLHIELEEIEPPIWRRIEVPSDITLRRLHDILQLVMGWTDSHLHCFEIRGVRYGFGDNEYDENELEDDRVLVRDVVHHAGEEFKYEYDYGDGWQHRIVVEQIRRDVPPGDVPRLLDGERACPPEDCGGITGYYEFLEAIADPDHEEHEVMLRWAGGRYDPEKYDVAALDRALALLRTRRAVAQQVKSTHRRRTTRSATPADARLAQLLELLATVREALPDLPPQTFDTAGKLLAHTASRSPDSFLSVRKPGIWVAAALHAAGMVFSRSSRPLPHLTIEELAAMFDVSPASVSGKSVELRLDLD
jgi:hypothetical protein